MNRQLVKQLRTEIEQALNTIGQKHGVSLDLGIIRFDTNSMRCTLRGNDVNAGSNAVLIHSDMLANTELNLFKGRVYQVKKTTFTVVAIHPNKPKFSLECRTQKGMTYFVAPRYLASGVRIS